jgi:hypothetical protein
MSVTINTTPYAVAPVGKNNPVAFAVTGSNRVATAGVARALSIVKSGTVSNGATIVFEWVVIRSHLLSQHLMQSLIPGLRSIRQWMLPHLPQLCN